MTDRAVLEELKGLVERYGVIRAVPGETFTLASGAQSNYYFDGKRVTQSPEAVGLLGRLIWEHAQELQADGVGGLAAGSIPLADAAIAYDSFVGHRGLRAFFVRSDRKEHGTQERVYQSFVPDGKPLVGPGRSLLIVDDVLTTGRSILDAVEEVRARGATVAGILVVIDRQDPRSDGLKSEFKVHALFVADRNGDVSMGAHSRVRELALA